MIPPSRDGVGTRIPSVPPVTQKNFSARLHRTCDSASVRMEKKILVYRTQMKPKRAAITPPEPSPPTRKASMEVACRYFTTKPAT